MTTIPKPPVVTFIYGWPDEHNRRRAPADQTPQLLSKDGEALRKWSDFVPEEFKGIIIETLLFDWYAVAHVSIGPDGRALPEPRIIQRAALADRERWIAQNLAAERAARHLDK